MKFFHVRAADREVRYSRLRDSKSRSEAGGQTILDPFHGDSPYKMVSPELSSFHDKSTHVVFVFVSPEFWILQSHHEVPKRKRKMKKVVLGVLLVAYYGHIKPPNI